MDAFVKKRKAPDGAADKVRPTFVVCPGAGGATARARARPFGKTTTIANGKWAGNASPVGANVQLVSAAGRGPRMARPSWWATRSGVEWSRNY